MSSYIRDISFENENIHYNNNNKDIEYLKFKSGVSYLYINSTIIFDILIVGGGGGGSDRYKGKNLRLGGGGGGGQVIYRQNISLSQGFYQITIGEGGNAGEHGGITSIKKRNEASATKLFDINIFTAGGGGSGINDFGSEYRNSGTGGGGGGAIYYDSKINRIGRPVSFGGIPPTNSPFEKSANGGSGVKEAYVYKNAYYGFDTGGGGGGGIPSGDYNPIGGFEGNGGIGMISNITGTEVRYGGGGGGGREGYYISSAGYGGGRGGGYRKVRINKYTTYEAIDPIPGAPNTGGGGGGYSIQIRDQNSARGGSGILILKIIKTDNNENNIYIPQKDPAINISNSIIICNTNKNLDEITIVKFNISETSSALIQYNIYIEYLKNRDENILLNQELNILYNKICEYVNEYYNVHNDVIELLERVTDARIDYNYLYSIDLNKLEQKITKSSILNKLYILLKEYFIKRLATVPDRYISIEGTDKFKNILTNEADNNYLNTFYNTLMEINTNIKYNDNIGKDDIYTYSEDLIKSNSILKFININNDNKYRLLKKWIFIKIDEDNDFHKEIKNNYESNKDKYIDDVNNPDGIRVSAVIIDITSVYASTEKLKYLLIDIETINKFLREKNQETDNYNLNINPYILNIYETLLNNYNYRIDLNKTLQNFDILFDVNKDIDKEVNILINNFLYYYNLIIVIVIIIMTIILHIFYIELFRLI